MKRVYVMDCGDFVKIGMSGDVDKREKQIPYKILQYYATKPLLNAQSVETNIHKLLFKANRNDKNGREYFNITFDEAVQIVRNVQFFTELSRNIKKEEKELKVNTTQVKCYELIKEICSQKGISVTSVEKQAGLGNGTISKWSESSPSVDKLKKVADVLKVPIAELVKE